MKSFTFLGVNVPMSFIISGMKYVIVGSSNFLLDLTLNWFLIKVVHINYLWVGYIVAPFVFTYSFLGHKFWSFRDVGSREEKSTSQLIRLIVLAGFNAVMNMPLMWVFYGLFALPLFWARVFVWAVYVSWNFPIMRYWVYRKRE